MLTETACKGATESPGSRDHAIDHVSCAAQTRTLQHSQAQLYTKLPSDKHIRLISLASHTVSEQDILRCSFVEQDIRDVIPWAGYNALSYVWGDSPKRVTIVCNGHRASITRNLYNALRQIWRVTPSRYCGRTPYVSIKTMTKKRVIKSV